MEDKFNQSLADTEFDWEFNAPHWHDFEKEDDMENPDSWFDEQEKLNQSIEKAKNDFSKTYTKETHKTRHPTRIPIAKGMNLKSTKSTTHFQSQFIDENKSRFSKIQKDEKSNTIISTHTSKFYSKLPIRVPLKEKHVNMKK